MDGSAQSRPKSEAVRPKRRKASGEERKRIVQASLQAGTSVEAVARIYGVNASQIYDWRKQQQQRVGKGKPIHPVSRIAELLPWNVMPSASLIAQLQSD